MQAYKQAEHRSVTATPNIILEKKYNYSALTKYNYSALTRASFNIATSGVSAPVGPSSGPVVKQKNLILPQ